MAEINEMTIEFSVNNQTLTKTSNEKIVEHSVNYLYAQFTFNSNWNNVTKKYAIVKNNDVINKVELDANNKALIPSIMVLYNNFAIAVIGVDENNYVVITTNPIYVPIYKTLVPYGENPFLKFVESTDGTINVSQSGDRADLSLPNIYVKDANLTNDILNLLGRDNTLLKSINMPYGYVNNITLELNQDTFQLTLRAYNKAEELLFTRSVDFDLEPIVFDNVYYDSVTKELVFVTHDGNEIRVPIGDILTGIATESWVNAQLLNYVQKESGKGLSTNDYTNQDMAKLDGIEANAQVNILEGVQVNGTDLEIADKKVNIDLTPYAFGNQAVSRGTMLIDTTNYVLTLTLYDRNNNVLTTQSVDLPSEDAIVSGTYDSANQSLVFTKQSGASFSVSIASLIDGLQPIIDANNKLSSDLVDDANATNKFVTAEEKAQITTNKNDITSLQNGKQNNLIDSTSIEVVNDSPSVKQSFVDSQFLTDSEMNDLIEEVYGSEYTL